MEITYIKPSIRGRVSVGGVVFGHKVVKGFGPYQTPYDVTDDIAEEVLRLFPKWFVKGFVGGGHANTNMSKEMVARAAEELKAKEAVPEPPKVKVTIKKKPEVKTPVPSAAKDEKKLISDCAQLEEGGVDI